MTLEDLKKSEKPKELYTGPPEHVVTSKERTAASRGNGYKIAEVSQEEILAIVIARAPEDNKVNLKKWVELFIPSL